MQYWQAAVSSRVMRSPYSLTSNSPGQWRPVHLRKPGAPRPKRQALVCDPLWRCRQSTHHRLYSLTVEESRAGRASACTGLLQFLRNVHFLRKCTLRKNCKKSFRSPKATMLTDHPAQLNESIAPTVLINRSV